MKMRKQKSYKNKDTAVSSDLMLLVFFLFKISLTFIEQQWNACVALLPSLVLLTNKPQETVTKLEVTSTFLTDKTAHNQAVEMKDKFKDDLAWVDWLIDFGTRIFFY